jgi:Ca-activated chloride channel family protein
MRFLAVLLLALGIVVLPVGTALADGVVLPPPACFEVLTPPRPVAADGAAAPETAQPRPLPQAAPALQADRTIQPVQPVQPVPPIRPVPPPQPVLPCWLTVRYHRVEVTIADQVATTRVDQVFANETGRDLEGTYVFPLPEDATVGDFSMWVDGQKLDGEVLTREEARRLYESIVRRNRDPALLEYVGRGAFQARVFPVPAGGERRLQLEYTQTLTAAADVLRYVYPLNTERFSARPLQQAAVSVTLRSARPLKAIHSPSHEVSVTRPDELTAQVVWEAANVRPGRDFELVFGVSPDPVALHVLTQRPAGEDGYFLLLAAPAVRPPQRPVAQDVSLVFDTSGSMAGAKIEQARGALRYVVNRLRPEDRFNIVAFASTATPFAAELQPAGAAERERALAFVDRLEASGGTNINDALVAAVEMVKAGQVAGPAAARPHTVIFVTDGLPTAGPREPEAIIAGVRAAAQKAGTESAVRVFPFGVGYDVNTVLLDGLASEFGGASAYVKPGENLEETVSRFYARVGVPVLTDLRLDFGGAEVYDLFPTRLPDLYAGGQVLVSGRYRTSGTFDVALSGTAQGSTERFVARGVTLAGGTTPAGAPLPRLWAGRKIAFLLDEIRRRGTSGELVDEVVALARRYGIATPYTSIFVPEPGQPGLPAPRAAADALRRELAAAPTSGAAAVQNSEATGRLRQSEAVSAAPEAQIRVVGERTFLRNGDVWQETTGGATAPTERTVVPFGSDAYFALLDAHPEAGRYLAVGPRLVLLLGGAWYEIAA